MPSKSKIEKLRPDIMEQVEQRIISQNYNDLELISEWLQKQSIDITTDNVYRHSLKLKKKIPGIMKLRVELEKAGIKPKCSNSNLNSLLLRLGVLHLKEKRIISQIVDMTKL